MRAKEFVVEASGHIPANSKEAHDPRWSNAITVDVQPGEDSRQAKKLGFDLKNGRPPQLSTSGKIVEAVIDVAVQGRGPVSAGAMGLMRSRADFGLSIQDQSNIHQGAVDAMAQALEQPGDVHDKIAKVCDDFKIRDGDLAHMFEKKKGVKINQYHADAMKRRHNTAIKI